MDTRPCFRTVVLIVALVFGPAAAYGQSVGHLTGTVTDVEGGVLAGVTVEASRPARMESSRVAFTDGAGRYLLVDLRPGVYNISFTLPGFSTVLLGSQEVPAGVTVTVNATLLVGGVDEVQVVSAPAAVLDMQAIGRVEIFNHEVLDAIPTGRNLQATAQLSPVSR